MARSFLSYLRDERNRTLYGKYLKENPDPDVNIGRQRAKNWTHTTQNAPSASAELQDLYR